MFTKALVIACAAGMVSAVKLHAKLELSSLAGVNIKALSQQELAEIKAATKSDYDNYSNNFGKSYLTEDEKDARQNEWLHTQSQVQQWKKEDPSYQADGTDLDDMTAQEKSAKMGTKPLQAPAKANQTPVPDHDMDEEKLARTGDDGLWNAVFPGCPSTYQYIYDQAVNVNATWGCESFYNWDAHWLEQFGYQDYYDYYVATGYISDEYLRSWWNQNVIPWRDYLKDNLNCTNEEDIVIPDNSSNICSSIDEEHCVWGDEYVNPIKNQGSCGSCYAFSTTQILESYNAIGGNGLISLSEQQIVDCGYGNSNGCNGGWPASVLATVADASNALWPEEDYEYTARVGTCVSKASTTRVKTNGRVQRATSNSVDAMKTALLGGPLALTVQAQGKFSSYSGGILRDCLYTSLDHAVNAVGWTVMDGVEVLKVRNSWGTRWGDAGYVYFALDSAAAAENSGKGPCGILQHAYWSQATLA